MRLQKFNRRYNSTLDYKNRLRTFTRNVNFIRITNDANMATLSLDLNEFADMSYDEFASERLSLPPNINVTEWKNLVDLAPANSTNLRATPTPSPTPYVSIRTTFSPTAPHTSAPLLCKRSVHSFTAPSFPSFASIAVVIVS